MSENIPIQTALDGLRADRDALLQIASGLGPAQWEAPCGCPGWSTKDLVSHMAALFWAAVDGSVLPDTSGLGVEAAAAVGVEARRTMTPAEVLQDYESVSSKAFDALSVVAALDMDIPFGADESYPASVVPLAYCFDHYTHIRADLFAPRGSLTGDPPPSDELCLVPALEWIEVALEPQNADVLANLTGRVELKVFGTGARTIGAGEGERVALVESDGDALLRWVTQRANWEDVGAKATGSPAVLEALRELKVY